MKIIGEVELIFRDITSNNITKQFTVHNHITDVYYDRMYRIIEAASGNEITNGIFIAYEEYERIRTPYNNRIMNVYGYGYTETGVTTPTYNNPPFDPTKKTMPYMEIRRRFDPKTTDIKINVVGLANGTTNSIYGYADADAWVRLATTGIQKSTETLDVYYRVLFDYDYDYDDPTQYPLITKSTNGISKYEAYKLMQRVCDKSNNNYAGYWYKFNLSPFAGNRNNNKFKYTYNPYSSGGFGYSTTINQNINKNTINMDFGISTQVGKIVGSIGLGDNYNVYKVVPLNVVEDGVDPIQNMYGHNYSASVPFYNSSTINDGTGLLSANGLLWSDTTFPKIYKINIIDGGSTGTSTYNISIRTSVGFSGNSYTDLGSGRMMYANGWNNHRFSQPLIDANDLFDLNDPTTVMKKYNFKPYKILHVQQDDMMLMDISTEEGIRIHNSIFPQFDVTNISGFDEEKDTGSIWVSCRENGLYRIDSIWNNPSVTKISIPAFGSPNVLDRCLGVATTPQLGGSGIRVWALFSDLVGDMNLNSALGLYYSDDNGVSWTKDTTWNPSVASKWTGSATEFLSMYGIWSDKNHPDCRLMVLYSEFKNYNTGVVLDNVWSMWHDAVSGTSDSYEVSNGYRGQLTSIGNRPSGSWRYGNTKYDLDKSYILSAIYGVSENQNMWGVHRITNWTTFISPIHGRIFNFRDTVYAGNANYAGTPTFHGFSVDGSGNDVLITITNTTTSDYRLYLTDNTGSTVNYRITIDSWNYFLFDDGVCIARFFDGGNSSAPTGTATYYVRILNKYNDSTINNTIEYDRIDAWVDYGWDGSNWVRNSTGKKTTHTTLESTIDGVKVAFNDSVDNVGGFNNWVATDYYTFGVADGIWLDGSTEMHLKLPYYTRTQRNGMTLLESSSLPVTTKSITVNRPIQNFTWQNTSGNLVLANNGRNVYGSGGLNSPNYTTWAQSSQFVPATAIGTQGNYNGKRSDEYARIELTSLFTNNPERMNFIVGISSKTRVTEVTNGIYNGIREQAPEFSVGIRGYTDGSRNGDITIYYSGVPQKVIPDVPLYRVSTPIGVHIMNTGHIVVTHVDYTRPVFTSVAGSPPTPPISTINPFEELYVDYAASNGVESGIYSLTLYHNTEPDYYLLFGSETSQDGHWNPNLFSIDYESGDIEVVIDNGNVLSEHIGTNDYTTPLTSGQYSIIYEAAAIRYSPDDVGKSISIKYVELDYPK